MKKDIYIDDETIKIIEHRKKLFSNEIDDSPISFPVCLIKLVQKAYMDGEGTASVAIFLETDEEFLITYDEVDDIDKVYKELLDLKLRTNNFRVEEYNIETKKTIDK